MDILDRIKDRYEYLKNLSGEQLTKESQDKIADEITEISYRLKEAEQELVHPLYLLEKYFKYQYEKDIKPPSDLHLLTAIGAYRNLIEKADKLWQEDPKFIINDPAYATTLFFREYFPDAFYFRDTTTIEFFVNLFGFLADYFDLYNTTDYTLPYYIYDENSVNITLLYNDIYRFYEDKRIKDYHKARHLYWKYADVFYYHDVINNLPAPDKIEQLHDVDERAQVLQKILKEGTEYKEETENNLNTLLKIKERISTTYIPPIEEKTVLRPRPAKDIDVIKKPDYIKYYDEIDNQKITNQAFLFKDLQDKILQCSDIILAKDADVEYNKIILNDLKSLCDLIFKGKYYWYDDIITLESWTQSSLIGIIIKSSRLVYCSYANYMYNKDKQWFLSCSLAYCRYITTGELEWPVSLSVSELASEYMALVKSYYTKVKKENEKYADIIKNADEDIVSSTPDLNLRSVNVFPVEYNFFNKKCGMLEFHERLAVDKAYKKRNKSHLKNWFISLADNLSYCTPMEYTDKSFDKLIDFIGCPLPLHPGLLRRLPKDMTFDGLLNVIKTYKKDDDIKYAHQQLLDNKEKLYYLAYIGSLILDSIIDEDFYDNLIEDFSFEEIKTYCYKKRKNIDKEEKEKRVTLEESLDLCKTLNAFHSFIKIRLDTLSSPEDFADYLKEKNKTTEENNALTQMFNEIFEKEVDILSKTVQNWKTYNPEKIRVKFLDYYNKLKPKIERLYGGTCDFNSILEPAITFIATGETMYDAFKHTELGDYGSLAINYYKALEWLLNQIIYKPYRDNILQPKYEKHEDLSEWIYDNIIDLRNRCVKESLELGTFLYIYSFKKGKIERLENYYTIRGVNINKLKNYVNKLYDIKNLRNDCAHPQVTTFASAVRGRNAVYEKKDEDKAIEEKRAKDLYELIFCLGDIFD